MGGIREGKEKGKKEVYELTILEKRKKASGGEWGVPDLEVGMSSGLRGI